MFMPIEMKKISYQKTAEKTKPTTFRGAITVSPIQAIEAAPNRSNLCLTYILESSNSPIRLCRPWLPTTELLLSSIETSRHNCKQMAGSGLFVRRQPKAHLGDDPERLLSCGNWSVILPPSPL